MVAASAVAANAQTDTTSAAGSSAQYQTEQQDKEVIPASELPSIVQEQLSGSDFSGWTVGNAYRKEKDGQTFYKVELSKDGETKTVKFDAQGNKVKEDEEETK